MSEKTGDAFDAFLAEQMKDPEFRAAYEKAQKTQSAHEEEK